MEVHFNDLYRMYTYYIVAVTDVQEIDPRPWSKREWPRIILFLNLLLLLLLLRFRVNFALMNLHIILMLTTLHRCKLNGIIDLIIPLLLMLHLNCCHHYHHLHHIIINLVQPILFTSYIEQTDTCSIALSQLPKRCGD